MGTQKRGEKTRTVHLQRFAQLAKSGVIVFHTGDLAALWQIRNRNTLHTTLKRYAKQGLIVRIYRGLYSLKPVSAIDPSLLGIKALHQYAYVSTETILSGSGIIQQIVGPITIMSSRSRKFSIGGHQYHSRRLPDRFLYNPAGIIEESGVKRATVERAVGDLLYFNPRAHFDAQKYIQWNNVKDIQKKVGYSLMPERY